MDNEHYIKLNLRGKKFVLKTEVYCSDPTSKLSTVIRENTVGNRKAGSQVYLDRNPTLFPYILDYYNEGVMHYPHWLCAVTVKHELSFWQLDDTVLASCCWHRYHAELEENVTLDKVRLLMQGREIQPSVTCKQRLHMFLTNHNSSTGAKGWAMFVLFLVVVSVFCFMLETLSSCRVFIRPEYESAFQNLTTRKNIFLLMHTRPQNALVFMEIITTVVLTIDFLMKLFSAPNKFPYMKQATAIADVLGVFPVWLVIILTILRANPTLNLEDNNSFKILYLVCNCFRLLRLFRFVHVMTHLKTLMLFYLALKASAKALGLLLILLFLYATIAANCIYFAEIHLDNFNSVFEGVWWAYITMTTVGYGDYYPVGIAGCIVGIFCAMTGILVIAMPVPVIVNNFSALYDSSIKVKREDDHAKCQNVKAEETSSKKNKIHPKSVWETSEPGLSIAQ